MSEMNALPKDLAYLTKSKLSESLDESKFKYADAPKDLYNIGLLLFFLFGVGGWMAWNAALTGLDYYNSRFKEYGYDPSFTFPFVFIWPLFLGSLSLVYLSNKISFNVRLYASFFVILVCSVSMPFITEYIGGRTGWWILMVSIVINGAANSFVQGGLFGYASIFPSKYMGSMMIGQGLSGFILNFIKILTLIILPPDNSKGKDDVNSYYDSILFLSVAGVILVACIFGFKYFTSLKFAEFYTSDKITHQNENEDFDKFIKNNKSTEVYEDKDLNSSQYSTNILKIYKSVLLLAFQATIVFGVTFLIYPGTILSTKFEMFNGNKSADSWSSITMLTAFTLCDTVGRFLAGVCRPFNKHTIAIVTFGRFVFIFTSIAIQLALSPAWLFCSDWFKITNMILFGISNGSLVMMYGPQQVNDKDKEKAGVIMNFHLIGGICISSVFAAFVMNKIPQHS